MRPGAVRTQLRLAQDAIARLAGVSRDTIRMYEADRDLVGGRDPSVRERCDAVYRDLAGLLERAEERRLTG